MTSTAARCSPESFGALGLAALLLATSPALAEPAHSNVAGADALFEEGKRLLKQGDWVSACDRFRRSLELDRSVSTHVKIARCHEHDGLLGSAVAEYRRARELNQSASKDSVRREELSRVIDAGLEALLPRVPKLELAISPTPSALRLSVDGREVVFTGSPLELDPGERELVISAPGYDDYRTKVAAVESATKTLRVELLAKASESPGAAAHASESSANTTSVKPPPPRAIAAPPASVATKRAESSPSTRRTLTWTAFGLGLASAAGAGYFGVRTLSLVDSAGPYCDPDMDECTQRGVDLIDQASEAQTISFVLSGVSAGLLGTGLVLHLTAASSGQDAESSARGALFTTVGPRGAVLGGRF